MQESGVLPQTIKDKELTPTLLDSSVAAIKAEDSIFMNDQPSTMRINNDSLLTSRWLKEATQSESGLRNLHKFKEYAPKIELTKITKARKLFED